VSDHPDGPAGGPTERPGPGQPGPVPAGQPPGVPRLDASIDAALLLTALASRAGDRVDLIAADRQVRARVLGAGRGEALSSVTGAVAALQAELTADAYLSLKAAGRL
jgi:uncharacterized protein (DUF58 family)